MKTRSWYLIIATAFVLILALLAVPVPSEAARGSGGGSPTLTAVYAAGANGLNPTDPSWTLAPVLAMDFKHINHTETGCGSGTLYEMRTISIRAVHNGTNIFFRFDWADPTADLTVADPTLFSDAVAIQFPIAGVGGGGGSTTIQMGNQNNPVNIIMWRADWAQPQNIIAGGIGTVQKSPDAASQNIVHYQNWANGVWTVIMSRPMAAASVNQVAFQRGMKSNVAFMNVDGSDCERNGHKTISQWSSLSVQ